MAKRRKKMAKRRVVYRTRAKKIYRRARGGGGSYKPLIDGFLAGAGGQVASKYIGVWGHPAAAVGVGYFRRNETLKVIGAREAGAIAGQMFLGGGSNIGATSQV